MQFFLGFGFAPAQALAFLAFGFAPANASGWVASPRAGATWKKENSTETLVDIWVSPPPKGFAPANGIGRAPAGRLFAKGAHRARLDAFIFERCGKAAPKQRTYKGSRQHPGAVRMPNLLAKVRHNTEGHTEARSATRGRGAHKS